MPAITMQGSIPVNLDTFTTEQVYNILDCAVTAQLFPAILGQMNADHLRTYRREKDTQALCLELSTTGFPTDQMALAELLWRLEQEEAKAINLLHQFCAAIDFPALNPRSPKQVAALFYTHLNLPPVYEYDRVSRKRKISTDLKALEKLKKNYLIAAPFVNAIDAAKSARKLASVFKKGLEPSTRLRCAFSPTGTESGRLSSQTNPYGRGTNAQNLTNMARQVICARDGWAIVNIDLKTAESIAVGYLSGDRAYIDACLSGDLHTTVAKLNWPELPWAGELRQDKKLAETPYYRTFTYRDMAKRGGHATNYYGTPPTIAKQLNLTQAIVLAFQNGYFRAFPGIQEWQLATIATIQQTGVLTTPTGRSRRFWGRLDDTATHREAIAHGPQSLVADVWNGGLVQLVRWLQHHAPHVETLAQVHDSVVLHIPVDELDDLVPLIQDQLTYPIDFGPLGTMIIPTDVEFGQRWNKVPKRSSEKNRFTVNGLVEWQPGKKPHWSF